MGFDPKLVDLGSLLLNIVLLVVLVSLERRRRSSPRRLRNEQGSVSVASERPELDEPSR